MRPNMKQGIPALLLLVLASCQAVGPGNVEATGLNKEVNTLQSISATATTASQVGAALGNPAVAGAGAAVAALADAVAASASKSIATPQFDPSKRFEYADVYVTMGDPTGMRSLVPYLMKPEEWMLIRCDMMTPTYKHYKFQRITTADGRALPSVDPFKTRTK